MFHNILGHKKKIKAYIFFPNYGGLVWSNIKFLSVYLLWNTAQATQSSGKFWVIDHGDDRLQSNYEHSQNKISIICAV